MPYALTRALQEALEGGYVVSFSHTNGGWFSAKVTKAGEEEAVIVRPLLSLVADGIAALLAARNARTVQ